MKFFQRLALVIRHMLYGRNFTSLGYHQTVIPILEAGLSPKELNHHVHIVGASGYGKSVLLSHMIKETIKQGKGLLFVDLKSDRDTIEEVGRFAKEAGREKDLKILSLTQTDISAHYNPLKVGTPTQLRDRIMMSLNWSEEYYRSVSSTFLLQLLTGLCWLRDNRGEQLSLADVLKCTKSKQELALRTKRIPSELSEIVDPMIEARAFQEGKETGMALQGLRSQLESLVSSDFGKLLSEGAGVDSIDLFEAMNCGQIVYVLLDSRRFPETAKVLARLVVADLRAVSARIDADVKKLDRRPFQVIVDEFSDIATEDFISFLDRARSSGMSVCIAHQELADLRRVSPEFAARLTGNTSTLFAFLQKNKESAEQIASMAGTREVEKETAQYEGWGVFRRPTGARSVRRVEEFVVHPNVIKSLRVGECVVIKKYPRSRAHRMWVHRPR